LEVLEYINTPEKAVGEIYRVLSREGTLILSVPYLYKFHKDQMRFSEIYLRNLFSNFKKVDIYNVGNAYSIILDIIFGKIKEVNFTPVRYILTLIYLPLTLFLSKKIKVGGKYTSGYFLIAKK
jgi:SAM-dependent methyltransferase